MKKTTAIQPTRDEDYSEWYQQVIRAADLAEHASVRGCMVIKPWGYAIWENMQRDLDRRFKATGVQNGYFPLFIPLSLLQKEASHIEGFAMESAVVTHHRLEKNAQGQLVPAGPLEEPLIVRPTSEMIIGEMFSQWITSYRDLPLLINQWANVVRWEMRTRLFLRTTEFLWQEGHTAHATEAEARERTQQMLGVYASFVQEVLAIPVIPGEKTPSERFPGAEATLTIEAMMQDRKAVQLGTSHFLGQNFARGCEIQFRDATGNSCYAWTTSWGVTTRLIGALIMVHSDDDGLVLPPRIASAHVVIIPVVHKEESRSEVLARAHALAHHMREISYHGEPIRVVVDERDLRGGEKSWSWVKKGVPLRLELGPREVASDQFTYVRRDGIRMGAMSRADCLAQLPTILDDIQARLYAQALERQKAHTYRPQSKEELYALFTPRNREAPEIHGGFAVVPWSGDPSIEAEVKKDLGVTIRCIPHDASFHTPGRCPITGKTSDRCVIYSKAY